MRVDIKDKNKAEIAAIFAALPAGVTSVNLGWNELYKKTDAELATVFAELPSSVTSVNLRSNYLGEKTSAELATAFAARPSSVASIDLSDNHLSENQIHELLQALPKHIKTVKLGDNSLFTNLPLKDADNKLTRIIASGGNRFLDLSRNGMSLRCLITPLFLMGYREGWTSRNNLTLCRDVVGQILGYLIPHKLNPLVMATQNGPLSCLAIKHTKYMIDKMTEADLVAAVKSGSGLETARAQIKLGMLRCVSSPLQIDNERQRTNQKPTNGYIEWLEQASEIELANEKKTLTQEHAKDTEKLAQVNLFLALATSQKRLQGIPNCGTILDKMKAQSAMFLSSKCSNEERQNAKDGFNQNLSRLGQKTSEAFPLNWRSVLGTLLIAATGVGLIALGVLKWQTNTFFVTSLTGDNFLASKACEDISNYPGTPPRY